MPKLLDVTVDELKTASGYEFSATPIDDLGATAYTLATAVVDVSSSVLSFKNDLEKMLKKAFLGCNESNYCENILFRATSFNSGLQEIHGFKLLGTISEGDYTDSLAPSGATALYDAVYSAIEATKDYGQILYDQDLSVNAVIFVITDGDDNRSRQTPASIKKLISDTVKAEKLDSLNVILIGVGADDSNPNDSEREQLKRYLEEFRDDASLNRFIAAGEANSKNLARIGNFVSRSVTATSQATGSGAVSSQLTF